MTVIIKNARLFKMRVNYHDFNARLALSRYFKNRKKKYYENWSRYFAGKNFTCIAIIKDDSIQKKAEVMINNTEFTKAVFDDVGFYTKLYRKQNLKKENQAYVVGFSSHTIKSVSLVSLKTAEKIEKRLNWNQVFYDSRSISA